MKKILLFDPSIATNNLGDEIIQVSIRKNWPQLFEDNYIVRMPTHTHCLGLLQNKVFKKGKKYEDVDFKIVCGTNLLYTNMIRPMPGWNVFLWNTSTQNDSVCLGVGIGKNSEHINLYTKMIYKKILSSKLIHSVRDEAAKDFLESMGFKAVNTGCPTLWGLNQEHCRSIPTSKANRVVFTLTSYQPDVENDIKMIEILRNQYNKLFFWPQTIEDLSYLERITNIKGIGIVSPNVTSYSELLSEENIDYVGNRLHGGIFALQHGVRTIIIGIDYRASEMHKNFSIPYLDRKEMGALEHMIISDWNTTITGLDFDKIEMWKSQFGV